ncbi:hypothetical protein GWI33_001487 [Rhynchophorus ferrugineus]|uniref:Cytochrome P450 n=1 Tax=Rhynchophorus ferrugineus TaxID=354439 RepID=A0A834MI23_RHYFE|nr:hypothetical protein GWI33_001487 [Rhynchophorus ferrugineus]
MAGKNNILSRKSVWYQCRSYVSTQPFKKAVAAQQVTVNGINTKDIYYKKIGNKLENDDKPAGWNEAKPFSMIPGPKPIPILGNIWRFFPGIGEYHNLGIVDLHKKITETYGEIAYFSGIFGKKPMVFCYNPDAMETISRNEGAWPVRYGMNAFVYYQKNIRKDVFQGIGGVLSTQGEEWFKIRSAVNKILMQPRTAEIADPDNLMPSDFQNELFKWTMESMAVIAYNKRIGVLDRNLDVNSKQQQFINSVLTMFDMSYKMDVLPSLWPYISTRNWRKFVNIMDTLTELNQKFIKECLESINPDSNIPDHERSVLERLLKTDRRIAITMTNDMLIAGIDTTGKTMASALYFLAKNPEKQEKLRQELKTYLPNKESVVNQDMIRASPYLKAVIKETTRLAPIAIGNLRSTVKDLVLSGYQIPKDTEVVSINILSSIDDKYFLKAQEFVPERWLRTTADEFSHKNVHPFASVPFGFGPRSCIGKRLANLELEVGLAKMIRNFQISWPHADAKFGATLLYGIQSPLRFKVVEVDN